MPKLSRAYTLAGLANTSLPPTEHEAAWHAILAAHVDPPGKRRASTPGVRLGRPAWAPSVVALLTPLRGYAYHLRSRRDAYHQRFRGMHATDPKGNQHHLPDVFDMYMARVDAIEKTITTTCEAWGLLNNVTDPDKLQSVVKARKVSSDGSLGAHTGEVRVVKRTIPTLKEVVQDMHMRGLPAGEHHWAQWEDPKTMRALRHLLGQQYHVYESTTGQSIRARRWYAYEHGLKEQRAREEWASAFDLWRSTLAAALQDNPHAAHLLQYMNSRAFANVCDDTMHAHRWAGKTPRSYPQGEAWRALPTATRAHLAMLHQQVVDAAVAEGALDADSVSFLQPEMRALSSEGFEA